MAISEAFSGATTIGATEYSLTNNSTTLAEQTDDGVYQIWIGLAAITIADTFALKVYEKVRSGDTQRLVGEWTITGPAPAPIFVTESLILMHGWEVTLTKISGTDRSIGWSIRKVA